MNDPVTNVEIEDVLSSIRRLVSGNARGERTAGATNPAGDGADDTAVKPGDTGAAEEAAGPDGNGMLVLTADHLVSTTAAEGEDEPEEAQAGNAERDLANETSEETHHWADDGAETAVEEIAETALAEVVHGAVNTALRDAVEKEIEAAAELAAAEEADTGESVADESLSNSEEGAAGGLDSVRFSHARPELENEEISSLENRIAGLEAAVAERDDQWEPDGEEEGENAGSPVETLLWGDDESEGAQAAPAWEADRLTEVGGTEANDVAEASETPLEPDVEAEVEASPEVSGEREAVEEQVLENPAPADPVLTRNLDRDGAAFSEMETVIDEDALREMVADIVRRELQGTLGERITRNVRKLVRREIHRALAARELD